LEDLFAILHEDADLLVVNKPAGLVCHPTKAGERSSLIGRARLYLNRPSPPTKLGRGTGRGVFSLQPSTLNSLSRRLAASKQSEDGVQRSGSAFSL